MKHYDYIYREIWLVYSCNEWKEHSSSRVVLVTTDEGRLEDFLREEIKQGNMEYEGNSIKEMVDNFDEDWLTANIAEINSKLVYGFYVPYTDGEEV